MTEIAKIEGQLVAVRHKCRPNVLKRRKLVVARFGFHPPVDPELL
jgi:hypothetical protein